MSAAFFSDLWRSDGGAAPRWEQEGKLILHPAQKIAAGRLYDITFVLHNAEEGQEARTHCSIHLSKLLDEYEFPVRVNDFVKESLFSGPGNLAPLLVFDFLNDSSMIIQSSPSVSIANNKITVTLTPRTTLLENNAIIISNLIGAQTASGARQLSSAHASRFSDSCGGTVGYGSWNKTSASLTLCIVEALMPKTAYVFSFLVTNPAAGQYSPGIFIEVRAASNSSNSIILSNRPIRKAEGDFAPLVVTGFSVAVIAQSTQTFSAPNNLTITLVPFTTIEDGHLFTISGFKGVYRDSDRVFLKDASGDGSCAADADPSATCHTFFKSPIPHYTDINYPGSPTILQDPNPWPNEIASAQWVGTLSSDSGGNYGYANLNSDSTKIVAGNAHPNIEIGGELRMSSARFIPAGQTIRIMFDVKNWAFGQAPPPINIQHSNGSVSSSLILMTSMWSPGSSIDALRIAGFNYTYASQSVTAANLPNRLTFFFQNYAVLKQEIGTKLTITGLVDTKESYEASDSRILREEPTFSGSLVGVVSYSGPFVIDKDISFTAVGYLFKIRSEARLITVWDLATKTVYVENSYSFTPLVGEPWDITRGFHETFGYVGAWNISTGSLVLSVQEDSANEKIYGFSFEVWVCVHNFLTSLPASAFLMILDAFACVLGMHSNALTDCHD